MNPDVAATKQAQLKQGLVVMETEIDPKPEPEIQTRSEQDGV